MDHQRATLAGGPKSRRDGFQCREEPKLSTLLVHERGSRSILTLTYKRSTAAISLNTVCHTYILLEYSPAAHTLTYTPLYDCTEVL